MTHSLARRDGRQTVLAEPSPVRQPIFTRSSGPLHSRYLGLAARARCAAPPGVPVPEVPQVTAAGWAILVWVTASPSGRNTGPLGRSHGLRPGRTTSGTHPVRRPSPGPAAADRTSGLRQPPTSRRPPRKRQGTDRADPCHRACHLRRRSRRTQLAIVVSSTGERTATPSTTPRG